MRPLTALFAHVIIYDNDNQRCTSRRKLKNLRCAYPNKLMFQYEFNYEYTFNFLLMVNKR